MAAISITPANVKMSARGRFITGFAGEAVTAGQLVYRDNADKGSLKLADADEPTKRAVVGIAANNASKDQPLTVVTKDGALAIGGTVATGAVLVLGATAGSIAPASDLTEGWEAVILAVGVGDDKVSFDATNPLRSGAPIPS